MFEIVKTSHRRGRDADERNLHLPGLPGYASTPTTLVSFCGQPNCADGSGPASDLIADADGNLFGTTSMSGANDGGTVFEVVKTARGYASTPTTLVSFCAQPNCADGSGPFGGLIADAKGNLFGTTLGLFTTEFEGHITIKLVGTVFEIIKTASGYASTPTTLASFIDGRGPAVPFGEIRRVGEHPAQSWVNTRHNRERDKKTRKPPPRSTKLRVRASDGADMPMFVNALPKPMSNPPAEATRAAAGTADKCPAFRSRPPKGLRFRPCATGQN